MALTDNKQSLECHICGVSIGPGGVTELDIKKETSGILLPGCDGSLIFNANLKVYFIVTKLFKSNSTQFIKLLPTSASTQTSHYGERLLYSRICAQCEGIVDKALDLHAKILDMQKKIDNLGEILREFNETRRTNQTKQEQDDSRGDKSQDAKIRKKIVDSSLACLGGIVKDMTEKKTPVKSLRSYVKNTSSRSKNICGREYRDPLEAMNLARDDEIGNNPQSPLSPPALVAVDVDNNYDGIDDKSTNEDHHDDDMDYVPNSSEEEMEPGDEEYLPDAGMKDDGSQKEETDFSDEDESHITNEHLSFFPNTNVTMFEYQCPECLRIFSKRENLNKHTKDMHGFDMHYSCPRCPDLKFFKKRLLVKHRIEVHPANGTECDICGKKLKGDRENLFQHYQHFHKIKYPCLFCKMTFTTRLALKHHKQETHTLTQEEIVKLPINRAPKTEEEKEWARNPCSECGKIYISGYKLDRHLMMEHEYKLTQEERVKTRRKCYFCWKILCLEQRHWIHCKLDHPEIKVEFPCDQCTPTGDARTVYKTIANLQEHFEQEHTGSTIHSCSQCKRPFLSEASLKAHSKIHINKKVIIPDAEKMVKCPFKCWFCWELFSTEEALQRHLKGNKRHWKLKVEFPCDDLECEYNQKPFSTLDQLKAHLSGGDHDRNSQKLFTCERCSWTFLSKEMLSLHQINHVPKLNDQFACPHPSCDHTVNFWRQLKDHYNVEHGLNVKLYKCSHCDTRFTMKRSLSSHIGSMHKAAEVPTASSGFPCDKCGKLCPTEKYLYHHLYRNHKDLKCQDCDKEFETLGTYLYHRKVYHGVGNPHMCAICGKVFAQKNALTRHMGSHNDKKFECHICGKKMFALATLQTHIKKFHGDNDKKKKEKGPSPFQCADCGQGYSRKDTLEDHVRVQHTADNRRVWSCDKCGKRFKRKGYLDAHSKSKKTCFESVKIMQVDTIDGEIG